MTCLMYSEVHLGLLLGAEMFRYMSGVGAVAPDSSRDLVPAWQNSTSTTP